LEREQAIGRSSSIKNTRREGAPYLTAALEDTLICMHARDAMGIPHANQFRLRSDCGDDAAAANLLAAVVNTTVVAGENLTVGSTVWLPAESVAPGR